MYSRVDHDPEYHREQLALAFRQIYRDGDADRRHREWMRNRPAARLLDAMYRRFHGIAVNPFDAIESPLPSEDELRRMADLSDAEAHEIGGGE